MVYQISSAMSSFCRLTTTQQAMQTIADAGFDSLDFPLSVYARGQHAPLQQDSWREWVRTVAGFSKALGLPITQAHCTYEQTIPEDFHYVAPYEIYARCMEACHMLGCRQLVFHPMLYMHTIESEQVKQRIHDWNIRWFTELLPLAERFDLIISLENTFDSHHLQPAGGLPFIYTRAQDMLALMHGIGSSRVQICLDTGHANISGQDIPAMIRAYRGNLATVHLNDNYGRISPIYEDLHLFPGYGQIAWAEVFEALREIRFRAPLNIEPIAQLRTVSPGVRTIQLRAAAQVLRALAAESTAVAPGCAR
ncbi:MAG: sugar phosphate isomerase/epimerase [Oscillospiraceae bacterium]|jgi:sugar phosphate isomerase/epimerase|nr:sugar phosphate isomerase/epimerase [Oscillospiraceae bacterium]